MCFWQTIWQIAIFRFVSGTKQYAIKLDEVSIPKRLS